MAPGGTGGVEQFGTRVRWGLGCLWAVGICGVLAGTGLVMSILIHPHHGDHHRVAPVQMGEDFYDYASLIDTEPNEHVLEALQRPFLDFVMKPNARAADRKKLENPEHWDERFYMHTSASVQQHAGSWAFFIRLEAVADDYAKTLTELRDKGIPEIAAAIPYAESQYRSSSQSRACAKGPWQFMPETAYRVGQDSSSNFQVTDCKLKGDGGIWSPTARAVPPLKERVYADLSQGAGRMHCRIIKCRIDNRADLALSTGAAAFTLGEVWSDERIRESGAAVQIMLLSHKTGYHDERFGQRRKTNVLQSLKIWQKNVEEDEWAQFYGDNIKCDSPHVSGGMGRCGGKFSAETQHYAYPIVAVHMLAACYYGQNHGQRQPFAAYAQYSAGDGYCNALNIPSKEEVLARRGRH